MGVMWETLVEVSKKAKDCWEKGEDGLFKVKDKKIDVYGEIFVKLTAKAVFGDDGVKHTNKDIAKGMQISSSMFYKFKTGDKKTQSENLKKILNVILVRLSTEGHLADDQMKKDVANLLYRIFKREEVKGIVELFDLFDLTERDYIEKRMVWWYKQELKINKIFKKRHPLQNMISYEDYFIDGKLEEEEISCYTGDEIYFMEYGAGKYSKCHVVIFDVKKIDTDYLHQRIRCLQRKDNVFAILMIEDGNYYDDINFYKDEHSNIMTIVYKKIGEDSSEACSYDYPMGDCLSWYDEKCKAFMTEGLEKIETSHK